MKKLFIMIAFIIISFGTASGDEKTLLIYREEITNNEPRLSVLTRIENDTTKCFILSNELFNSPYFVIELTEQDFNSFREAFNKFLEWESIAVINNPDSFTRAIPVTAASNNVTWSWTHARPAKNTNSMRITFQFDWNPLRRDGYKALLNISSNSVQPRETNRQPFCLEKNYLNNEEVNMFLYNVTDEKIAVIIEQYRERESETEHRKLLIDELFQ